MGKRAAIDISSSPVKKAGSKINLGVIELTSSPEDDRDTGGFTSPTPVRAIFCVKTKANMRDLEKREDCFLLDFDPDDDAIDRSKLRKTMDFDNPEAPDIAVVAEKGHVACRDFPHARHLCLRHPFDKTPHESYCELCYCFVCDSAAPCLKWSKGGMHCHAFDNEAWKRMREVTKRSKKS